MKETPTHKLLRDFGAILVELRQRGICRSENIPTGDLAEYLACKALGLSIAAKSAKGFDALDASGIRYQVKGRRITPWNPSTQLSAIRDLPNDPFDFLIAVLFDKEFRLTAAYRFSVAACQQTARFVERTNSYTVFVNNSLIFHPDTLDLTSEIQRAYEYPDTLLPHEGRSTDAPKKRMTQRDVMRELVREHPNDDKAIIQGYARAEMNGVVTRSRNVRSLSAEQFAVLLLADGIKKGWIHE